ncbi:sigma-70 family RNA polymerase sigma factor [Stackebrandtia soli]|uniref:sigma-70 family RNA polymerase sigma factor n=1 Tax=Stackebrandtia soli TaxID=1892856 RepID=UPI0039E7898B
MDEATRLALAARDGDPARMAGLVRLTQPDVWRLCAALVDAPSADDLTQETYLRAWRALPGFAGASTVRTWLLSIARRACADHIRGLVRQRRTATRHVSPDVAADASETVALDDLLARLPVRRRSAFVLTQVVGLSYAEAAVVENVPVGTIRSRVARARDDLVRAWSQAAKV